MEPGTLQEQVDDPVCPSCGSSEIYGRFRLASLLPVPILLLLQLITLAIAGVLLWRGSSFGALMLLPTAFAGMLLYTEPGSRWYWGGWGCKACGEFTMLR